MAVDALVEHGAEPAGLSADALRGLDAFLPAGWSRDNPVDVLGDADPERFGKAVELLAANLFADGVRDAFDPRSRRLKPSLKPLAGGAR